MEIEFRFIGEKVDKMCSAHKYCDAMKLIDYRDFLDKIDNGDYNNTGSYEDELSRIATIIVDNTDFAFETDDKIANHAEVVETILNECTKFYVRE